MTRYLMNTSLRARLLGACAALAIAGSASPAFAQTATANLGVSAEVTENCTVSTTAVAFGNVDVTSGSSDDATGAISVLCSNGTDWSASADAGEGVGASLLVRKMSNGGNVLNYALYTEATRTTIWGDGTDGSTIDGTGTGAAQSRTIYARVPAGQGAVPPGSYADTVIVTVAY